MSDPVNPSYYSRMHDELGCDVIDIIHVLFADNFDLGQVMRYISRAGYKPGNSYVQDLKKARRYLDWAIEASEDQDMIDLEDARGQTVSVRLDELKKHVAGYLDVEIEDTPHDHVGFTNPSKEEDNNG